MGTRAGPQTRHPPGCRLKIEWAHDRAYRFFPVQRHDLCGYRLHDADAATNNVTLSASERL